VCWRKGVGVEVEAHVRGAASSKEASSRVASPKETPLLQRRICVCGVDALAECVDIEICVVASSFVLLGQRIYYHIRKFSNKWNQKLQNC